jgi:hypothetical protein
MLGRALFKDKSPTDNWASETAMAYGLSAGDQSTAESVTLELSSTFPGNCHRIRCRQVTYADWPYSAALTRGG